MHQVHFRLVNRKFQPHLSLLSGFLFLWDKYRERDRKSCPTPVKLEFWKFNVDLQFTPPRADLSPSCCDAFRPLTLALFVLKNIPNQIWKLLLESISSKSCPEFRKSSGEFSRFYLGNILLAATDWCVSYLATSVFVIWTSPFMRQRRSLSSTMAERWTRWDSSSSNQTARR